MQWLTYEAWCGPPPFYQRYLLKALTVLSHHSFIHSFLISSMMSHLAKQLPRAFLQELAAALPALVACPLRRMFATRQGPAVSKLGIPGVEHIIAVASGKGGVGKSTTAGRPILSYSVSSNLQLHTGLLKAVAHWRSEPGSRVGCQAQAACRSAGCRCAWPVCAAYDAPQRQAADQ